MKTLRTIPQRTPISRAFVHDVRVAASITVLALAGVLTCSHVAAQTVIVPRVPVNTTVKVSTPNPTLPSGNPNATGSNLASGGNSSNPIYSPTVLSGQFGAYQINQSTNTATITETSNAGILSWNSFNIGQGATVNIVQPSSTAILLNRISGSVSATSIQGALNANGIVYLYNPNGIVFGKTATVNVNSLVASTLNIDNNVFLQGLLTPSLLPSFSADPTLGTAPGSILIDGDGSAQAQLNAAQGGKIMLFAPNITNNGVVTAPNGQVIMAAGGKVYLSAPTDTSMRGLFVEVDNSNLPANSATGVTNNGTIAVGLGNATLAGMAVNQNGSITANTSVNLNGSIYLQATAGAQKTGTTSAPYASVGGALTLGSKSVTQINIVDDGSTATQGPTDNPFVRSQVTLSGQNIVVQDNAQIIAKGGNVTINAAVNPSQEANSADASSVSLGAHSLIDVSGASTAVLPMSSNVISVQLLSELADNLVLRNSVIRGQTLNFDIRQGTTIADISADLAKIPYTVSQLAATGGTVKINASGSIVQETGSKIDVSGGAVSYSAGYVNTSFLSSGGALFSDSNAGMNRTYSSVVNLPNGRWDYEPGYTDGKSAGTVDLSAPSMALQGSLVGNVTPGANQRNVQASNRPLGGQLIIGTSPGSFDSLTAPFNFGYANALDLDNNATMPATASVSTALASNRLDINVDNLVANGFSRLTAYAGGPITVAGNLNLPAGGSLSLYSPKDINFDGGVQSAGGSVYAKSAGSLTVASGSSFDLAGTWVNDMAASGAPRDANGLPTGDIVTNGGSLTFDADHVILNANVAVDVSGGAWLTDKRKLTGGKGGSIALEADNTLQAGDAAPLLEIGANLQLSGYGLSTGGSLTLQTNNIQVGGVPPSSPDVHRAYPKTSASGGAPDPSGEYLWLPVNFFSQGGFSSIKLSALNELDVNPGAQISAIGQNWVFNNYHNWQLQPSGAMSSIAVPGTLNLTGPMSGRKPVNLILWADETGTGSAAGNNSGNINVGYNATITTDPGAAVTLQAGTGIYVDGTINDAGGTISLALDANPATTAQTYNAARNIWIGPEGHLLAQGTTAMLYTNPIGTSSGEVLGGGTVNLNAQGGYLVVQPQSVLGQNGGATIDVSGSQSNPVTLGAERDRGSAAAIASAGGSVNVSSDVGILFSGTMLGKAGSNSETGGTLNMALETVTATGYPTASSAFNLVDGAIVNYVPTGVLSGQPISGMENQAWISTGSFGAGGFDRLAFKTDNAIVLGSSNGTFNLNANSSIYLDAPVLAARATAGASAPLTDVQIKSAYVQLGSDDYLQQNNPTANVLANPNNNYFSTSGAYQNNVATSGTATLNVNATTIDLVGNTVVQGVQATNLTAAQDIRLVGVSQTDLSVAPSPGITLTPKVLMPTGEFSVAGDLTLTSTQVYPTTLSSFALNAEGAGSNLNFVANGAKGYAPLAAGGTLFGFAQNITQGGTVEAPFGLIDLVAGNQLTYTKGSTTSVAGSGVIPFGMVVNGRSWDYDFGNGNNVEIGLTPGTDGTTPEIALPSKVIISNAPNVTTQTGATLNLSGGGSLYAYEFTPGSFGTVDVLANNVRGSATQVFAILPGYGNAVAPRDYQYGQDGGLQAGQSVYLSGIAGLPAGNYVLLPAHYALLPGAMEITLTNNGRDMIAANNVVNLNGSLTVAGRTNVAGNGDARTNAVTVTPGSVVRQESQYQEYSLASYFTSAAAAAGVAVPELPTDGGHLEFDASTSLALTGQFLLAPATGGRAGIADISAPVIDVVGDASQSVAANALKLVAGDLNAIGADSLLLGGIRQASGGVTNVAVGAQSVTVENTSATALSGTEIILAAQNNVTLAAGATVDASGKLGYTPSTLAIQAVDPNGNSVGTDGALLRVSAGSAVTVQRSNPAGVAGVLNIGQGAVVGASGSAYLDATLNSVNDGQLQLASGAALGLGAQRISLGSAIPANVNGLQFNSAALSNLSSLASLTLSSYSTIDLYGTVNLGSAAMQNLTLDSAGMQGNYTSGGSGNVTFSAQNVQFGGGANFVAAGAVNGGSAGTLTVQAQNITAGNGAVAIKGYGQVDLNATGQISGYGNGSLTVQNGLAMAAGAMDAGNGANVTFAAGGAMSLTQVAGSATTTAPQSGGTLQFNAASIVSNANINAASGTIGMTATNGIAINGGTLNAAGTAQQFGSTTAYASGGIINLNGGTGNVSVGSGALLDVSAIGASAGTLNISATGANSSVTLAGTMHGAATAGVSGNQPGQGSFTLDVGHLSAATELDQLAGQLSAEGFTAAQSFRVRNGDVTLDAGSTITAHDVTIAADNGNVTIGGKINASGAAGGTIALYAAQTATGAGRGDVTLLAGSLLDAHATAAATSTSLSTAGAVGTGGSVLISTGSADGQMPASLGSGSTIGFNAGAVINVAGNSTEQNGNANGTVTFRAPQLAGGNDIAISGLSGSIAGSRLTEVEGYKVYVTSQVSAAPDQQNPDGTYANLQAATSTGAAPTSGVMFQDAQNFANGAAAAALASRSNPNLLLSVLPGIEVRSSGDLTVSVNETSSLPQDRGWNLDAWHMNGLPVNLTLRAQGNLDVNGSISDGFIQPTRTTSAAKLGMPDWTLDSTYSANIALAGGADFSAANPLAVIANSQGGDVQINFARTSFSSATDTPVALVRTGTGNIDIAAGGDVVLGTLVNVANPARTLSAAVYTAGMQGTAYDQSLGNFTAPKNLLNAQYGASSTTKTAAVFGEDGGTIAIVADGNVIGAPQQQVVNNWLFHQGDTTVNASGSTVFSTINGFAANTAWWSRPDYFDQGIATMAGGNVSIIAGGNLQDVSASVASNAFMPGAAPGVLVERGGGNLTVRAGGNIAGGSYYDQNGQASLAAGGSVVAGSVQIGGTGINTILAMGDAQFNVQARGDLSIATVYNPTMTAQAVANSSFGVQSVLASKLPQFSYFSTFSDASAVTLTSVSGDVRLVNNQPSGWVLSQLGAGAIPMGTLDNSIGGLKTFDILYDYMPANVNIVALNGSITSTNGFSMAGSASGELNLLAANSIYLSGTPVTMLDVAQSGFSPYYAPVHLDLSDDTSVYGILQGYGSASDSAAHTTPSVLPAGTATLHAGDSDPVHIIALNGSIVGSAGNDYTINLPKAAQIQAGQNIQDLGYMIQQNAASDVTSITAGNNIIDSNVVLAIGSPVSHVIDGPGRLDISAGHNVDLGDSAGIVTRGNLDNPYMNYGGAAINVVAGATTSNYAGFVKNYVTLANLSTADQSAMVSFVNTVSPGAGTSASAAWSAFQQLPAATQNAFLNTIKPDLNALFFTDLVNASKVKGLTQFDGLIASLFPTTNAGGGDVNVFASQLKTNQGGAIDLFTPVGSVYAGLPNMPTFLAKAPSDEGIYTIAGGSIGALVHTNFEVDQGRVFTLGGGDITLVSQYGDLSAGNGTKTASSAPPPIITTNSEGVTVVDISGSISGSGIATLQDGPNVPASSVYVIAPRGTFDAGDAGVRSSGSVEVNAAIVLNAGNIVAAGAVTGVPAVEAVNIGAGLSNSATPNVSDVAKNIASTANNGGNNNTSLTVDVLGYGTEATPAPDTSTDADRKKSGKH